jgi:hypothetical protein
MVIALCNQLFRMLIGTLSVCFNELWLLPIMPALYNQAIHTLTGMIAVLWLLPWMIALCNQALRMLTGMLAVCFHELKLLLQMIVLGDLNTAGGNEKRTDNLLVCTGY